MNRVTGALTLAFALWYGFEAFGLKSGFGSGPITPKSFPLLLAVILGLTGIAIFFSPSANKTLSGSASPEASPDEAQTDEAPAGESAGWPTLGGWLNMVLLLVSFVAYAFLLVPIGFVAATTLETGLISQRFGAKLWQALATGLLVSLSLYALFVFGLGIPLPVGSIFGGR